MSNYQRRQPGALQAGILLSCVCFAVLASAIVGPVLPKMQEQFKEVPRVNELIPIVVTLPLLVLGILGAAVGKVADSIGRKRMFVIALLLYGICGTAPTYLDSLPLILLSRLGVGLAEAAIMTCSTTLIGDYWHGTRRDRLMSLQTTFAATSAVIFNTLGGILGEHGWRTPFNVYGLSLVLLPLVMLFIWDIKASDARHVIEECDESVPDVPFNLGLIAWTCVVGFIIGMVFMVIPVQFAFMLVDVGTTSPERIGMAYALNSVGIAVGTLLFGWLIVPRLRVAYQFALAFLLVAAGFLVMGYAGDYETLTMGGMLNGLGCGFMLPAAVTWNMRVLPFAKRGVGTGTFLSLQFLGYFFSPVLIMPMVNALGSRAHAVHWVAMALFSAMAASLVGGLARSASMVPAGASVKG